MKLVSGVSEMQHIDDLGYRNVILTKKKYFFYKHKYSPVHPVLWRSVFELGNAFSRILEKA